MTQAHPLRQDDFTGGEIARTSWGKRQSPAYQHGLRTALNFLPTLDGPIHNRPGTKYVCAVKDSTTSPALLGFRFSDTQTLVLEVGALYIRFISNGAQVTVTGVAAYNGATPYVAGDLVLSGGVNYYCIAPTIGNAPPNATFWYALTGNIYEIPAPWAAVDLSRLQGSQDGDVITISCLGPTGTQYAPQELTRVSNTRWVLAPAPYVPQAYFGQVFGLLGGAGTTAILTPKLYLAPNGTVAPAYNAATVYAANDLVVITEVAGYVSQWISMQAGNVGHPPETSPAFWLRHSQPAAAAPLAIYSKGDYVFWKGILFMSLVDGNIGSPDPTISVFNVLLGQTWMRADDDAHPAYSATWVICQVWQDAFGRRLRTLGSAPFVSLYGGKFPLYRDRRLLIQWGTPGGALAPASYQLLGHEIYRGKEGTYGLVGVTDATTFTLDDEGQAPNFGIQPPRGTNPFDVATGAGTKTQSYPAAVANHEQRIIYGRSTKKPQDFWGSAIGQPHNFDINTPVQDSDSFDFKPASEQLEDIRSMLSLRHLLLFTGGGVWNCYGSNGPLAKTNVVLRRSSRQSSWFLRPLAIEMSALFYTSRGHIQDLTWDFRTDNYSGRKLTLSAKHLFTGRLLIDWCYAEHPFNLVYATRDDGTLLTMTYEGGRVEAWARHTTLGRFEKLTSVYEVDPVLPPLTRASFEDAVYTVVYRVINGAAVRYIERFSSRIIPKQPVTSAATGLTTFQSDVRLSNFLDAAILYDGRGNFQGFTVADALGAGGAIPGGGGVLISAAGNAVVDAGALRGFNATDVGKSIILDQDGAAGGPYEIAITGVADVHHASGIAQVQIPAAYNGVVTPFAGQAVKTIGGLDHLKGMTVGVLGDGAPLGTFLVDVATSTIVLPAATLIAQIGLPYVSDWEMLDAAGDSLKLNVSSVRRIALEVEDTLGMLFGETFDIRPGRIAPQLVAPPLFTGPAPAGGGLPRLFSGDAVAFTFSSWNVGGRACVRQTDPLPLTIVAATRELVVGGK